MIKQCGKMSAALMAAGLLVGRTMAGSLDPTNAVDQVGIPGAGGLDSLQDATAATQRFYRVAVKVSP